MSHFLKYIHSKSTVLSFVIVILMCASIVIALLVQVDVWNKAAFDLVKNNSEQMRLVITMRDVVQKRALSIQKMLSMKSAFDRDAESIAFHNLDSIYAHARENLLKVSPNKVLLKQMQHLDEAVAAAYSFHERLVEMLIIGQASDEELKQTIQQGQVASGRVLSLLDQIVDTQLSMHDEVLAEYESSRQTTLLYIIFIFATITAVATYALRISKHRFKTISRMTIVDDVSGTYNRRYFDMVLEEEWKRSMREYTPLSLLMVDIDFFKSYNDKYGHQMGDACLYTVGKILSEQLKRATDFTARYGGEEFAILLPNTRLEYARLLAERLRRAVEEARIKAGNEDVSPWVTVSIGVATTTAEYEQSSAKLIKAADSCLYNSKLNGRNRVSDKMLDDLE